MRIGSNRQGAQLTVTIAGELDHHCAQRVKEELDTLLSDQQIKRLVLDFKGLTMMDSSGIGVIIGRYKIMSKRKGWIEVRNMNRSIDKIMAMAGLYQIIRKIG
ncbi:MAG: anti-sigma factor antagonist [Christensenellales bacterium]|jgi:stage II sporulation protein AA (anti-sigma F factor antagonist)